MTKGNLPTAAQPIQFSLSYKTAAALEHILNAQSVIAEKERQEGRPALAQSLKQVEPFWMAISAYLAKPPK